MLRSPVPRLRVVHNSNTAQKVELVVRAGDELDASPHLAAQLARANTHFEVDADALAAGLEAERKAEEDAAAEAAAQAEPAPEPAYYGNVFKANESEAAPKAKKAAKRK